MEAIHTLLIANRGEIASRIIRTCRQMGIRSVAVYSEADRRAVFVQQADLAVFIGASPPERSYLDQEKLIAAAQRAGANAIHPGYGFLSENAAFARRCTEAGLIFVGPHAAAIAAMGSKSQAKALMQAHGVPVVPGYQGEAQDPATLAQAAREIGFPLLLKAAAGGGGKGMRIVREAGELPAAIAAAKREALNAFGDDELIIEKYIAAGRHIEFQIFGDQHGNALHLLERECTIQRRYQKVMEESPSPVMTPELRRRMGEAAVRAAQALRYDNAGTVEFIYDERSGEFYFLEVNTRLQVEHPVTEAITGLDLVQMQLESAQGLPLKLRQEDVSSRGYALELRLYAEDARQGFRPVAGRIERWEVPTVNGLRVESAVASGTEVSVYYDPLLAKLIVWDAERSGAFRKMRYVLENLVCLGMVTNQDFLLHLVRQAAVQQGQYDTHYIEQQLDLDAMDLLGGEALPRLAIAASLIGWAQREARRVLLRSLPSGWRNNFYQPQQEVFLLGEREIPLQYRHQPDGTFEYQVQRQVYPVLLHAAEQGQLRMEMDGLHYTFAYVATPEGLHLHDPQHGPATLRPKPRFPRPLSAQAEGSYTAPMPATIVQVLAQAGQRVQAGEPLLILSSMKMEQTIAAHAPGQVAEVLVQAGTHVEAGALLLTLTAEA
jgi:acetyl-CoA carboxylase biotin carboxylase subunit